MAGIWANLPVRFKGLVVLAIPVGALLLSSLVFHASHRREAAAQAALLHSLAIRDALQDSLTALIDAETGTRGFLLTGEAEWLEPYHLGLLELRPQLERLQDLTSGDDVRGARTNALMRLIDRRLQTLRQQQDLAATDTQPVSVPRDMLVEGRRAMEAVRQEIGRMVAVEDALILERQSVLRSAYLQSVGVTAAGGLVGIGGGIVAILLFTSGVAARVHRLEANAGRLARGEPLEDLPGGFDEIGQLASRLEVASTLLRQREAALVKASQEIQDLYDRAPCGYHSLDANGVFVSINETELSWLGYAREEVVGRRRFTDLLAPEGIELFRREFPEFKQRGWVKDLEFELIRKDGSRLPVLLSATTITDEAGHYVSSRSTVFDNTARRQAELEIRKLTHELQRRLAELEAVNHELEAFSYSVSHDLRAPLRHVQGFARLLREHAGATLDETSRRYLGTIGDAAVQMGRLIDDLLAFSRMGRADMVETDVDLAPIAGQIRAELEAPDDHRRIEWTIRRLPRVRADAAMLRIVMMNLLSNAVKYCRGRDITSIEIGSERHPGEVVVYVRDNGAGFDMKYADKLFKVFQRLHRADEFEGTGIGLATVRRIVHRHGGRTWAEGAVGKGATFYFSLPVRGSDADGNEPETDPARRGQPQ